MAPAPNPETHEPLTREQSSQALSRSKIATHCGWADHPHAPLLPAALATAVLMMALPAAYGILSPHPRPGTCPPPASPLA
jgi:hypothetical protein